MKIPYPMYPSEFEVQAKLYNRLLEEGFDVCGSITISGRVNKIGAQLDLVIFNERNKAICIIETKSEISMHNEKYEAKYQIERYATQFRLPVLLCWKEEQFDDIIEQCRKISKKIVHPPITPHIT